MLNSIKKMFGIDETKKETNSDPTTRSIANQNNHRVNLQNDGGFQEAIKRVTAMPSNTILSKKVNKFGLNVVNVMWEDTARTIGSAWGANITDMTLQIQDSINGKELLPVVRYPNFTDKTGDIPFDSIKLKVGNEKGNELEIITLREYLTNLSKYLSYPDKFNRENKLLVSEKDTHALVSAQACFLPIPQQGRCKFNPVLYNYQSRADSPAVLAMLISTEGTSATILNNSDDKASWGQNVYFNNNGQKTCLTGERLTDFKESQAQEIAEQKGISVEEARSQVNVAQDVNMVMVVQVPLKVEELEYLSEECSWDDISESSQMLYSSAAQYSGAMPFGMPSSQEEISDMEDAVIGHGEDEGEHLELKDYKLERDDKYPIRVTVQFYKATSNGIVDDEDLENIRQCIEKTYNSADFIGSLVVGTLEKGDLKMGEARPTQPAPSKKAILGPPKDYLEVVDPFEPHQKPKAE